MLWIGCFLGVGWCLGLFVVSWIDMVFTVVSNERIDFGKVVYIAVTIGCLLTYFFTRV